MYQKQHTIQQEFTLEGQGLHTGTSSSITVKPAPENHGVKFQRVDLPDKPIIPADLDYVTDLSRSTTLQLGDAKIHTVEHVMAALAGMQIDNVIIEISGIEPPILDGSAKQYTDTLREVGALEQKANREFYIIEEPIHYQNNEKNIDLAALPFNDFRVTTMVDYNSRVLGIQHATMVRYEDFEQEIAPSRTFCFFHEIEGLLKAGLIKGGSLDNAIVIVEREWTKEDLKPLAEHFHQELVDGLKPGILNDVQLRFPNEPARHKLLDLIGDLALIGSPLKCQILAARPGHASNIAFGRLVRKLVQQKRLIRKYQSSDVQQSYVFDVNAISEILPHRYPFLLIDRITRYEEKGIEGYKNVTINEPFFQGHFPGNPIMPAVLQLEAMAQIGGILLLNTIDSPKNYWVYFVSIDKARFKRPVVPGDQIHFKLDLISMKRNMCKMWGTATVDGQLVCEAEMMASLVRKKDAPPVQ